MKRGIGHDFIDKKQKSRGKPLDFESNLIKSLLATFEKVVEKLFSYGQKWSKNGKILEKITGYGLLCGP